MRLLHDECRVAVLNSSSDVNQLIIINLRSISRLSAKVTRELRRSEKNEFPIDDPTSPCARPSLSRYHSRDKDSSNTRIKRANNSRENATHSTFAYELHAMRSSANIAGYRHSRISAAGFSLALLSRRPRVLKDTSLTCCIPAWGS